MAKQKPAARKQKPSYKAVYKGLRQIEGTGYGLEDVRRVIESHRIPYHVVLYPGRHGKAISLSIP